MKAYITKYALTMGIQEKEVTLAPRDACSAGFDYYHRGQWHRTLEFAKEKAESIRVNKIASLEKKLKELQELRF